MSFKEGLLFQYVIVVKEKEYMNKFILFLITMLSLIRLYAQDPQYSQFYANALYLSPAFAGAEQNTRAIVASRYQWPGLDAAFLSHTVSVDHYFTNHKSGIGIIATSDLSTASKLKSTEAGIIYSYQADLSKKIVFRPALQLSYVTRSINFSRLSFASQFDDNGFKGGNTNENSNFNSISYADISTGGLLYSEKYWIGFSAHHLNRPDQSFMKGESRLPVKAALFGGYKFSFTPEWRKRHVNPDEEKSISPTFLYKMQGKSDQLDLGLYGRYNKLVLGIWYRGIPVKLYKSEKANNDAIILLFGVIHNGFQIGYSFDYTISKLTIMSGGSHELTLSYGFKTRTKKKIQKRPACPKF